MAAPFQRANEPDRGAAGFPTPFRRENESHLVALQDSPLRVAGIRTRPSATVLTGNTGFFLRSAVAGNLEELIKFYKHGILQSGQLSAPSASLNDFNTKLKFKKKSEEMM